MPPGSSAAAAKCSTMAAQRGSTWQQATAERILRRLLIAGMACVTVWQLAADPSPAADEARLLPIRLSGRQMKRTRPYTAPALLAGLWVLLAMLDHYTIADLRRAASLCFPALKEIGFV